MKSGTSGEVEAVQTAIHHKGLPSHWQAADPPPGHGKNKLNFSSAAP